MPRILFAENPFRPDTWEVVEGDLAHALRTRFPTWPETARIYDIAGVDEARLSGIPVELGRRDVTPRDRAGARRLERLPGPFLVSVPPALPVALIIAIATVALSVAISLLLTPKIPSLANQQNTSPNNALSSRTNQARPGARIPDIFGEVIAVPDLIAQPYSMFIDNLEVEIAYMCLGRGSFDISQVKDGTTLISQIAGAAVEIYGPNTSPNSGDDPVARIGSAIGLKVLSTAKTNDVNGQTLRAPNANYYQASSNVRFVSPDTIQTSGGVDFTKFFGEGDTLDVAGASFGGGSTYLDANTQQARFYPDYRIEFASLDPRTMYVDGQTLIISNAGFAGQDSTGKVVYVDVSGSYVIDSMTATMIQLVTPTAS